MHPILSRVERLVAYLSTWLAAGVVLSAVFSTMGLGWIESLVFLLPLFFVYSFACLSSWYISRATPIGTSSFLRLISTSGFAALLSAAGWLALARVWVGVLTATPMFGASAERYERQMPVL